jgi:hypothetical protein
MLELVCLTTVNTTNLLLLFLQNIKKKPVFKTNASVPATLLLSTTQYDQQIGAII